MTTGTTPDPAATSTAVDVPAPTAPENLPARADRKKKGTSVRAHAAIWMAVGFFLVLVVIAAWPLFLLITNGGNGDVTGGF